MYTGLYRRERISPIKRMIFERRLYFRLQRQARAERLVLYPDCAATQERSE